jgi:hypothetical protein
MKKIRDFNIIPDHFVSPDPDASDYAEFVETISKTGYPDFAETDDHAGTADNDAHENTDDEAHDGHEHSDNDSAAQRDGGFILLVPMWT